MRNKGVSCAPGGIALDLLTFTDGKMGDYARYTMS